MKVAMVTSELVPFSKTGGLADVCGALPKALAKSGTALSIFTPYYRSIRKSGLAVEPLPQTVSVPVGDRTLTAQLARAFLPGTKIPVYFVLQDDFFDRDGLYGTSEGDHPDNASRFIFFSRAVLEAMRALKEIPDVVHVHDWQSALIPVYLKTIYSGDFPNVASLLTIHNLAYQGLFWHWDMKLTGLPWSHFNWREMEFFGKLNFLKSGLVFSDAITTVSPSYAREIQTEEMGCGLEGVLRTRAADLHGILNGADYAEWDPAADAHLPTRYTAHAVEGKALCKAALQRECRLPVRPDVPLFAFIGRLAEQKGIDLLLPAVETMVRENVQFVFLGSGDAKYQAAAEGLGRTRPDRVSMQVRFDNALAHRIEAGADFFVMPSRYEPCGLNQIYSLRYGTPPVVRATGGLIDTIEDGRTGFVFQEYSVEALVAALRRAHAVYAQPKEMSRMMTEGMQKDFSWEASARKYTDLYRRLRRLPVPV